MLFHEHWGQANIKITLYNNGEQLGNERPIIHQRTLKTLFKYAISMLVCVPTVLFEPALKPPISNNQPWNIYVALISNVPFPLMLVSQ